MNSLSKEIESIIERLSDDMVAVYHTKRLKEVLKRVRELEKSQAALNSQLRVTEFDYNRLLSSVSHIFGKNS